MMQVAPGDSDSPASILETPVACDKCGATVRVARGTCMNCLLLTGVEGEGEVTSDEFERVLEEANVPDVDWRLGNYQILGEIGRGGMGVIYRARQRHSRRVVALKRVLGYHADSHERLSRFRREAEAAASLDHPNILPIYEVAETEEGFPFFSMKWASGGSLREVGPALRKDPRACVRLMAKVARAIECAHARGILHRDLQPGNILLDSRGEPLVSDFGLAKIAGENSDLTRTMTTFGTPGYIAPEQAEGAAADLTPAADIYSLGAVLFNLLTGRPPFCGTNALTVIRQASEQAAPKLRALDRSLDRDLETIVARCLERAPHERYKSAGDLAEDLERWLDGRPIRARRVLPPLRAWRWCRRNPLLAAASIACLLLVATVLALLDRDRGGPAIAPPERSIAVLPFADLNNDQENAFFAAGMHEEILTDLGKLPQLKVLSPSSARTFPPGMPRDLRQIGRALHVRYVLEGGVRRSTNRVRISTRLLDTRDGTQLWAEQYEGDLPDVFAIQGDIAKKIAAQLQAHLSPHEEASLEPKPSKDIHAYELYLRAKEIADRAGLSTAERTTRQVALLNEAISRDPAFVPALWLLGRTHVFAYWSNHDHTPARLEAAHGAIEAAAQLQPDAGEVHLARGVLHYWGHREYQPALAELELARAALPNNAEVPYFIGLIERRQGKWEESTRHLGQACAMDPRNQVMIFDLARTNYFALKRYREAAKACDSVLAWKPDAFAFILARAKVDVASRGDLRRWQEAVWGEAAKNAEAELLAFERLDLALAQRDYAAAERALAAQPLPEFNWAGYVTPRAFYEGLIADGLGQHEKAHAAFTNARNEVSVIVARRRDDAKAYIILARIQARLREKAEAIATAQRAMELRPPEKDAVDGPNIMCLAAGVFAQLGETERALDLLEHVAKMPFVTNYGGLKLEDTWDSLRDNPRFQRILDSLGPAQDVP